MNKNLSKLFLIILPLIIVIVYAYFYTTRHSAVVPPPDISTFEECAATGNPVMETYPETCRTPDGTTYTRVTTDESPTPITISGTYTCLPKKNTGGPVTLECALGLQTDAGYYALDTSVVLTANYPYLTGGESITVEGALVPIEMVSADRWQIYDAVGIIAVDKIIRK